uniref:Putative salivary lipocalin n=1 Tax=Ixodes ricinus TaxID=34613 RepID=A0A0K8R5V9_IXORI
MLSVWVLALCLLISGRMSEGDTEQKSSKEAQLDGSTSSTSLSGPIFSYFETNPTVTLPRKVITKETDRLRVKGKLTRTLLNLKNPKPLISYGYRTDYRT